MQQNLCNILNKIQIWYCKWICASPTENIQLHLPQRKVLILNLWLQHQIPAGKCLGFQRTHSASDLIYSCQISLTVLYVSNIPNSHWKKCELRMRAQSVTPPGWQTWSYLLARPATRCRPCYIWKMIIIIYKRAWRYTFILFMNLWICISQILPSSSMYCVGMCFLLIGDCFANLNKLVLGLIYLLALLSYI